MFEDHPIVYVILCSLTVLGVMFCVWVISMIPEWMYPEGISFRATFNASIISLSCMLFPLICGLMRAYDRIYLRYKAKKEGRQAEAEKDQGNSGKEAE